jgi:hypothetical protein
VKNIQYCPWSKITTLFMSIERAGLRLRSTSVRALSRNTVLLSIITPSKRDSQFKIKIRLLVPVRTIATVDDRVSRLLQCEILISEKTASVSNTSFVRKYLMSISDERVLMCWTLAYRII